MNTLKTIADSRHTPFLILLCGLLFRAFNIDALSPIVDETGHLWESVNYSMYAPLDRLISGKYLGYLFYKPIYLSSWDPLYVARLFTALISIVAAWYVYLITRLLCSHYAGIVAMISYLASPFTYFHDRQAIFDPLASAFFAASLYYFLAGQRKRPAIIVAGALFALGLSVKIYLLAGFLLFVTLFVSIRYSDWSTFKASILTDAKRDLLLFLSGSLAALSALLVTAPSPGYPVINFRKTAGQLSHFLLQQHGQSRKLSEIPLALLTAGNNLISEYFVYSGSLAAVFILLALMYSIVSRRYRWLSFVVTSFACFYLYGILSYVFNRYTHFLHVPVSIFCGSIFMLAFGRWRQFTQSQSWLVRLKSLLTIEGLTITIFLLMIFDQCYVSARIMNNPYFRIATTDKFVYELGWPNAIGLDEVAAALKDLALKSDRKIHVVTIGWGMHGVWTLPLKFRGGGYQVTFSHQWIHSEWQRDDLREIMKTGRVLFLLEHPVAFIDQKELLRIGSQTNVLFTYQKRHAGSYYELIEVTP